jgi:5-methylcytosine-specific restriction endonuclease McrA
MPVSVGLRKSGSLPKLSDPPDVGATVLVISVSPRMRMKRQHTYPPVGKCIYCGSDGLRGKLTNEHIIPENLGGALLLPSASCNDCAKHTAAFEGHNAGNLFRPIRRQLHLPTKSRGRKDRERKLAETFTVEIGNKKVKLPPDQYPGMLLSFRFPMPDFMIGSAPRDHFSGGIALTLLPGYGERLNALQARYPGQKISFPTDGRAELVGRLIAKIAHAYAVAEVGLVKFRPWLLDIILNRPPLFIGNYVGSAIGDNPKGSDLHEISIDDSGLVDRRCVFVKIQLFADREMPVHYVIAGERL